MFSDEMDMRRTVKNSIFENSSDYSLHRNSFKLRSKSDDLWVTVKSLIGNKSYLFLTLALALLYFIITGIQFWITDYLQSVLQIEPTRVFPFFSFTCVTAPTLGVVVGGSIIHR